MMQLRRQGIAALLVFSATAAATAQQPRDDRRSPAAGLSAIMGVVLLDSESPVPLRRARVTLNGSALSIGRTVISADDGSFSIDRIPAGRYTLGVVKDGYVPVNYGARRPGRPGSAIVLRDRETRQITLRMPRGSVITGTIMDGDGQPASGVRVSAMRFRFIAAAGERRMTPARTGVTDDRGVYRIYGLDAGDYFIVAQGPGGPVRPGDLQLVSAAEVRRALAEVGQTGTRAGARPPAPNIPSTVERPRSVALAPVFYPGAVDPSSATPITLGRAEERTGVDFDVRYVPTAIINGTVGGGVRSDAVFISVVPTTDVGAPSSIRTTTLRPDGRFTISGVEPGKYTVLARQRPALWGKTDIDVNGEDVSVGVMLQPGLTFAGRVTFEGAKPPPAALSRIRIPMPVMVGIRTEIVSFPRVDVMEGGRFTVAGVVPGVYRFSSTVQGIRTPIAGWWVKSVTMGGRELLDAFVDLQRAASDVVVTFSDRASELSGTVRDAEGNGLSDRVVVVFGTDRASWFSNSRRVVGERPDPEGRYVVRNLPPGEYFIVVTEDLEQNEWFDPAVLETLAPNATRIVLNEHEQKQQDWTLPASAGR